jgi:Tol biopolymer transport system component
LQRQRKPITVIIAGGVAVLLAVAVADALRSAGADTRPPPAEASPAATEATETAAEPSDTDQGGWDGDATPVPAVPADGPTGSKPLLLDLETGETTPLARSLARGRNFATSLDGRRLAFVAPGEEGRPQVFVARIDGTQVRQVTHEQRGAAWPAWSSDGRMIAYEDGSTGRRRSLFVLDLATGESKQVADNSHGGGLQFTPGGSKLVYTGGEFQLPELRVVPVAGGESTRVVDLDSANGSFSPDGSRVTFFGIGYLCDYCRLLANSDGTDARVVNGCLFSSPAGTWSPDGRRIVCQSGNPNNSNKVVVVDMTTGRPSRVAKGGSAVWVDNHTLLVEPD